MLPHADFTKHRNRGDGLGPYCKECWNTYKRAYRLENLEKTKALEQRNRKKNRETPEGIQLHRDNVRRWRERHPDREKNRKRVYKQKNKEKVAAYNRKWNELHADYLPELRSIGKYRRRARMRLVKFERVGKISIHERDRWRCQICGCSTPRAWMGTRHKQAPELDHRVPISRGGEHTWENCQTSCHGCNMAKSNKVVVGQLPMFANPKRAQIA